MTVRAVENTCPAAAPSTSSCALCSMVALSTVPTVVRYRVGRVYMSSKRISILQEGVCSLQGGMR